MTFSLDGTVSVVVGANGALGRATAALLAEHGAIVVACGLEQGATAIDCVTESRYMDVCDRNSVRAALDHVVDVHGRLDSFINFAGVETAVRVEHMCDQDWDTTIGVHLTGTFITNQEAYVRMKRWKSGRIINISSQLAYKGAKRLAHYSAAKAGVLGFTRAFALEAVEDGVLVNAVAPGPVDSPLLRVGGDEFVKSKLAEMPIGRFGTADEIAGTVLLLASGYGSFYVGQTLSPCGGDVML